MNKLEWCKQQKKGIELIDVKLHLSDSYMIEADDSIVNMLNTSGSWQLIIGYYACYNALYSILMKCGIKSEIHDCSIALMSLFNFSESDVKLISKLKDLRIKNQYYLEKNVLEDIDGVKDFVLKCKQILNNLKDCDVEKVRGELE